MAVPDLPDVLRSLGSELLNRENVVTVSEGTKYVRGEDTGEPAIVVYVTRKQPKFELSADDVLPVAIGGVPVDVVDLSRPDRTLRLPGADLRGIDLRRADLRQAELREANLARAGLAEADLRESTLVGAILTGADLRGADLRDARIDGANLDEVAYDDSTNWPSGFTPRLTVASDVPTTLFVGREDEVARIADRLTAALSDEGPAVVLLSGPGGAGKSSIARVVLDRVGGRFDVVLVGFAAARQAESILDRFLVELGIDDASADVKEQRALYQRLLLDRHVLVVLEDVELLDAEELAALLPRASSSAALITARETVELPDAVVEHVALEQVGSLSQAETAELLARLLGNEVPSTVAEMVGELSGGYPFYVETLAEILRRSDLSTLSEDQLRRSLAEAEERLRAGRASDALLGAYVQPEPRIARDYWTVDDHLGYGLYASAVSAFVRHPATRPPLTIGIKAPWGAGKTSLMRMIQARLDPPANWETWEATRIRLTREARARLRGLGRIGWWWHRERGTWSAREGAEPRAVTNYDVLRSASGTPGEEQAVLEKLQVQAPDTPGGWRPTVWFNPWMYQTGEQIWAGLAHEIISQITDRMERNDRELFFLKLNVRRIDKHAVRRGVYRALVERFVPPMLGLAAAAAVAIACFLVAWLAALPVLRDAATVILSGGVGLAGVGGLVQTLRFLGENASTSFVNLVTKPELVPGARKVVADEARAAVGGIVQDPGYEARLGYLHLVQADVKIILDLVATDSRPVVVFVDDLDRCSPGAVAQVIEAVNLFLAGEFPNCIFVLALEPAVVAAHVETAYKDLVEKLKEGELPSEWSTLGWRFLEKIVQLPLSLPPAGEHGGGLDAYLDALLHSSTGQQAGPAAEESERRSDASATGAQEISTDSAVATPGHVQGRQLDTDLVSRLEASMRKRRPTLDTLPEVAREAQAELLGTDEEELRPETVEAANVVFQDLYSDAQAREAIEAGLAELGSSNPREVKRFVNLFRFYSFVAYQRMLLASRSAERPDARQTAKIAALAIRWPQLLDSLSRPVPSSTDTVLAYLEERALLPSSSPPHSEPDGSVPSWASALLEAGLVRGSQGTVEATWSDELNAFLSRGPRIGDAAKLLL